MQRALRRVTQSGAVAGLMALSGAMFGGCMPTVRPDMRAMGPVESNSASLGAASGARSFDSGASTTETDISDPAQSSQDQAPTTGRVITQEDQQ